MVLQYSAVAIQTDYTRPTKRSDIKRNLEKISMQVDEAIRLGELDFPVRLVALAEGPIHGWPHKSGINKELATEIPGEETYHLGELCKRHKCYLIGQMHALDHEIIEGRVFNTAFIINPDGKVIHRHRKTAFFSLEPESTAPSDIWDRYLELYGDNPKRLLEAIYPVARTDIGNIGTLVCAEGSWPEAARALGINGAEIIWRSTYSEPWLYNEMWEVQNRSHAVFNTCYVISPNHGQTVHGRTQIYDFKGRILSEVPYIGDGWCSAIFNIDSLRDYRCRSFYVNPLKAIRVEHYIQIYKAIEQMGGLYPRNLHMKKGKWISTEEMKEIYKYLINRAVELGIYTSPPDWKPYEVDKKVLAYVNSVQKRS